VTARTLQNWVAALAAPPARPPGRPPTPDDERRSVLWRVARVLRRLGIVGWRIVQGQLPDLPRRLICDALRALAARRDRRRAARRAQVATHTTVHDVGTMWSLDATLLGREWDDSGILGEVLMDAASRKVLDVTVGSESTGADVIALLRAAAIREGGLPLVLVTDNGSAYCSDLVETWLINHGVLHLHNLPRTPQHNAQAERGIGLLKQASEIGAEWPRITTCATAELAVQHGLACLERRPRAVLDHQTTTAAHQTTPRWYTRVGRKEVLDDERRARELALQDAKGARAIRRAERHAILDTLQRRGLISRTRGGKPIPLIKREEET